MKNSLNKIHSGKVYTCNDENLVVAQTACLEKLYDYNHTRPREFAKREQLLKSMFAEIGKNCYIEPPLHANWGGRHVHFGRLSMISACLLTILLNIHDDEVSDE